MNFEISLNFASGKLLQVNNKTYNLNKRNSYIYYNTILNNINFINIYKKKHLKSTIKAALIFQNKREHKFCTIQITKD